MVEAAGRMVVSRTATALTALQSAARAAVERLRRTRAPRYLWAAALVGVLWLALWLRIEYERGDTHVINDEGISLLAATCHEGEYTLIGEGKQAARWVPAWEWTRFVRIEKRFCFGTIAADLVRRDRHPPLYFWALHLWLLVTERPSWLVFPNLVFSAATCLLVYALGLALFGRRDEALAAAVLWAANPHSIASVLHARPNALLGATSALFLLALVRATAAASSRRWLLLLGFAAMLSMLTQYLFSYLVAAAFAAAVLADTPNWRRWSKAAAATACGLGAAALVHPVVSQMSQVGRWMGDSESTIRKQAEHATAYVLRYYDALWSAAQANVVQLGLVLLLVGGVCLVFRFPAEAAADPAERSRERRRLLWAALTLIVGAALFVAACAVGVVPRHVFAPQLHTSKHVSLLMPLAAVVTVALARLAGRLRPAVLAALMLCVIHAGFAGLRSESMRRGLFDTAPLARQELTSKPIIVNSDDRKQLPIVLAALAVERDAPMFVADQSTLLENAEVVAEVLRSSQGGTAYISRSASGKARSRLKKAGIRTVNRQGIHPRWLRYDATARLKD